MRTFVSTLILVSAMFSFTYAQDGQESSDFRNNAKYQKAMANIPDLTEDQQAQIDGFIQDFVNETKAMQSDLSKIQEKESNMEASEDVKAELNKKREVLAAKVLEARKGLEERISSILTPEQLEKVQADRKSK